MRNNYCSFGQRIIIVSGAVYKLAARRVYAVKIKIYNKYLWYNIHIAVVVLGPSRFARGRVRYAKRIPSQGTR